MNRGMNKGNKAIRHESNKRYRGIAFKLLKIFAIPQYIYTSIPLRKRLAFSLIEIMISLITVSAITAAFAPVISKKLRTTNIVSVGSKSISCKNEDCMYCDATGNVCYICNLTCAENEYQDTKECKCKPCSDVDPICLKCKYDRKNGGGICTLAGCPKGQYVDMATSSCQPCSAGYYQPKDNSPDTSCTPCDAGYYSGAAAAACSACPAGQYSLSGWAECQPCSAGYYCNGASPKPNQHECEAGTCSNGGASDCSPCNSGKYCPDKATSCQYISTCPAGKYSGTSGKWSDCSDCSAGYYCSAGSNTPTQNACGTGTYCEGGCETCPNNTTDHCTTKSTLSNTCITCNAGYYLNSSNTCSACSAGYYCSQGSTTPTQNKCPPGQTSSAGSSGCSSCNVSQCTGYSEWCTCNSCNNGFYPSNGSCASCQKTGCASYSGCTCTKASSHYYMKSGTPYACSHVAWLSPYYSEETPWYDSYWQQWNCNHYFPGGHNDTPKCPSGCTWAKGSWSSWWRAGCTCQ